MREHKILYKDEETGRLKFRDAKLTELKYLALSPQELNVLYDAISKTLLGCKCSHEYEHHLRSIMAECREAKKK